jgi:hypothetical protein
MVRRLTPTTSHAFMIEIVFRSIIINVPGMLSGLSRLRFNPPALRSFDRLIL